jgi:hypothetical protein
MHGDSEKVLWCPLWNRLDRGDLVRTKCTIVEDE